MNRLEYLFSFIVSSENIYGFVVSSSNEKSPTVKMDDFEFSLDLESLQITSTEEFLEAFVTKINILNSMTIESLLDNIIREYEALMGVDTGIDDIDDIPLFKECQQIFELENDNFDMKFTDRIRLDP